MQDEALHREISQALVNVVLRRVENTVKALRPDTSAIAQENTAVFEAGFRAAKRAVLDALDD